MEAATNHDARIESASSFVPRPDLEVGSGKVVFDGEPRRVLMPELPEVENVRRGLEELLSLPRRLESIELRRKDIRYPISSKVHRAAGEKLLRIRRRGKYLLLDFESCTILSHLGMTGMWSPHPKDRHDHVVLHFSENLSVHYNDPRRFGCFEFVQSESDHPRLKNLGFEPWLSGEQRDQLIVRMKRSEQFVKVGIMDNKWLVGVGNIYASEALFRAQISPLKRLSRISRNQMHRLFDVIESLLEEAIVSGGTTFRDYRNARGEMGQFQNFLRVYDRAGEPCQNCGSKIRERALAGRSTYWCPKCQRS